MSDPNPTPEVGASLRIIAGSPTSQELAAVTAVLAAALDEAAAEQVQDAPRRSAWDRTGIPLRTTLQPGPGAWRGFTG
jgi:Acyl-CoA carboxylase epsilon subunit